MAVVYNIFNLFLTLLHITLQLNSTKELAKVPYHGFLAQRFTMAGSEPLIQEADPLHSKLDMEYKDGPIKKSN